MTEKTHWIHNGFYFLHFAFVDAFSMGSHSTIYSETMSFYGINLTSSGDQNLVWGLTPFLKSEKSLTSGRNCSRTNEYKQHFVN